MERKRRSEAALAVRGIPVNPFLSTLPEEEDIIVRSEDEVARRSVALAVVAARASGLEPEGALEFLESRGLWQAASREEQTFLLNPDPPAVDLVGFAWRFESLWVLLWALGYIEPLGFPDTLCDTQRAAQIVLGVPFLDFLGNAALRTPGEILDQVDFIYRCHWATAEARFRDQPTPGNLDPGVVFERHYALNWLIHHQDQDWDDVTTET